MRELQIGRVYRHFKGDYYLVEGSPTTPRLGPRLSFTASFTATAGSGSARWRCF